MPISVYPSDYPAINKVGIASRLDAGLIRTGVPSPEPNQLQGYNQATEIVTATFQLTADEYWPWIVWMDDNGWDWFEIDLVNSRQPADLMSKTVVRLNGPIQLERQGHQLLMAACPLLLQPGQAEDPAVPQPDPSDIIKSGPPANPPNDIIVAGTPASPSTDVFIARLTDQ